MDATRRYNIAFKGLGVGVHRFDFEAGNAFFESFENPEIRGGRVDVVAELHKGSADPNGAGTMMIDFRITGNVTVLCDRCLEDCSLPVDFEGRMAVKFTESELDEGERYDGEVMWLQPGDGEIPLAQYIYESVVLGLPYQRVHPDGPDGKPTCNPDMLDRFRIISEEEFDKMEQEASTVPLEGSELEKLRKLKDGME